MRLYKILSILLEYPSAELAEYWHELEESIDDLDNASEEDKVALREFLSWAQSLPLLSLQANYVKTFDQSPENALYLTHHLFEEQDRERGPTLVELSDYYKSQGFEIDSNELPDYLPLILEYVSTLDDETQARLFLKQSAEACEIVAVNLESIESPYAALIRIIERHGRLAVLAA